MKTVNELELVGKTIVKVEIRGVEEKYDDKPYLVLLMSDGTVFIVVASYGGYTGNSVDEYPSFILVKKEVK